MIISPLKAYKKGYITGLLNPDKQVGSDGVDVTIQHVAKVDLTDVAVVSEDKRLSKHRNREGVGLETIDGHQYYVLTEGVYDITFNESFNLPKNVSAIIMLRSTLVRNGCTGEAGLYDSGFNAVGGMFLHVKGGGRIRLQQNVRIAQAVFVDSNTHKLYDGQYNKQSTGHWLDSWKAKLIG